MFTAFTVANAIICIAALLLPQACSFTNPLERTFLGNGAGIGMKNDPSFKFAPSTRRNGALKWMATELSMSSEDESNAPRKRRRRKDGRNSASVGNEVKDFVDSETSENNEEPKAETESIAVAEPTSSPKNSEVKAMDIRDVVAGRESSSTTSTKVEEKINDDDDDYDDELEDDEEYEYYYTDENNNEVVVGTSSSGDNSLESLLADARRMRESDASSSTLGEEAEESSIKSTIKSVLSNIVTADFFVVCALLAWFLAGIFCSYVIKDDTVQIAFNGIFEPVVQPALGILMIGSAAGAAFNDDKEE